MTNVICALAIVVLPTLFGGYAVTQNIEKFCSQPEKPGNHLVIPFCKKGV